MQKFLFIFLIGTILFIFLYAFNPRASKLPIFSNSEGLSWVEESIESHPEILWLADNKVRKTEEGSATLQGTYSEQLFGQKYIEFDRTLMTLHCLKLILNGNDIAYRTFTAAQPEDAKLQRSSFQTLHEEGQRLLKSNWQGLTQLEMAQVMESALVLGDIGKSEKAREIFSPFGITAPDHDDFYGEAIHVLLKNPELCPTFEKLPEAGKKLLSKVANLAHYGHISHLEGGLGMFSKLKESHIAAQDPVALSFDLFIHTCDVAGALGHVNNQSSLAYTEPTFQAKKAVGESVRILSEPKKSELDSYNTYLGVRASLLGLNPNDNLDRVLTRVGAMLRLTTPEEGKILKSSIQEIGTQTLANIVEQLGIGPKDLERTPTYMPAVLVNLSNNPELGTTKEQRLKNAIIIGLPFIAKVLQKQKKLLVERKQDPAIPLNFNKAAGIAKSAPNQLGNEFTIDPEGNVILR